MQLDFGLASINWTWCGEWYISARKRELLCFPDFTEMETQPMQDFQDLCTFESFKSFWHYYGYGVDQQELIDREFKRIKGK